MPETASPTAPDAVALVTSAIHNPSEPRHFMRAKPVPRAVQIIVGDTVVAETRDALRVLEAGHDLYDPVLYIPVGEVTVELEPSMAPETHCPLKGDAEYYDIAALGTAGIKIAWAYPTPFAFADILAGRVAFYADRARVVELDG